VSWRPGPSGGVVADAAQPCGLVVAHVGAPCDHGTIAGLALRVGQDGSAAFVVRVDGDRVTLTSVVDGEERERWEAAVDSSTDPTASRRLQVLDDGDELRVIFDGRLVLGPIHHRARPDACGVGVVLAGADTGAPACQQAPPVVFEAHPRQVPCPAAWAVAAPRLAWGDTITVEDRFGRAPLSPAPDLDGSISTGGQAWRRSIGSQAFALTDDGLVVPVVPPRVRGSRLDALRRASGVRTAYTIGWERPGFADLAIEVVPPGTARHQGEGSRAGLCFAQDDANLLIVNLWLDDNYEGCSISSFHRLNGYEEVFDAVWTNVGDRVGWGRPTELRVSFDGDRYAVACDGETVMYRAITDIYPRARPLRIERVGIVANWEFGQDTGSVIRRFTARV